MQYRKVRLQKTASQIRGKHFSFLQGSDLFSRKNKPIIRQHFTEAWQGFFPSLIRSQNFVQDNCFFALNMQIFGVFVLVVVVFA